MFKRPSKSNMIFNNWTSYNKRRPEYVMCFRVWFPFVTCLASVFSLCSAVFWCLPVFFCHPQDFSTISLSSSLLLPLTPAPISSSLSCSHILPQSQPFYSLSQFTLSLALCVMLCPVLHYVVSSFCYCCCYVSPCISFLFVFTKSLSFWAPLCSSAILGLIIKYLTSIYRRCTLKCSPLM